MKYWKQAGVAILFGLTVGAGAQYIVTHGVWHGLGYVSAGDVDHRVYLYTDGSAQLVCVESFKEGHAMSCVQVKP